MRRVAADADGIGIAAATLAVLFSGEHDVKALTNGARDDDLLDVADGNSIARFMGALAVPCAIYQLVEVLR